LKTVDICKEFALWVYAGNFSLTGDCLFFLNHWLLLC